MMRTILTTTAVALAAGWTLAYAGEATEVQTAATDTGVETCKKLQNSVERLACYDAVAGFVPSERNAAGRIGWVLNAKTDEFSGRDTSYAYLESDKANMILSDAPSIIVVRCDGSGGHEIYVKTNGYIGARNGRIPVRYMFDDGEPVRERWNESTEGTAAFLPNSYQDFRTGLQSGSKFIFEVTDFRGTSHRATFEDLNGNRAALDFVLDGCAG